MNLSGLTLTDRKRLTSHCPICIVGEPKSGKTTAFANLSEEERKRTVVFNFDITPILPGEDDNESFAKVYTVDRYIIEDIDMPNVLCADIIAVLAYDECDRILIDTASALDAMLNRWAIHHFKSFPYGEKNNALYKIITTMKLSGMTYGKFTYMTAHYPPKIGINETKRYITIKGNEFKNSLEKDFPTVVESYLCPEDRKVYLEADSFSQTNTTTTRLESGYFKFPRVSIDDLEQVLSKRKHVVDGKLVEI